MRLTNIYWAFKSPETVEELHNIIEDMLYNKDELQRLNIDSPILKRKDGSFDIFIDNLVLNNSNLISVHIFKLYYSDGTGYNVDFSLPLETIHKDFDILIDSIYVE